MKLNLQQAEFVKSAASRTGFLRDGRPQIVFAGRSNVGKSSVINRLLGRKKLARVSAVPGKTAQINYFSVSDQLYLVDLPGYGYAKVSASERKRWAVLMEDYFAEAEQITLGVSIVDARHKPTQDDVTMVQYFKAAQVPFLVVANKADKLKKSQLAGARALISETLEIPEEEILLHSAETGQGRDELLGALLSAVESRKDEA